MVELKLGISNTQKLYGSKIQEFEKLKIPTIPNFLNHKNCRNP